MPMTWLHLLLGGLALAGVTAAVYLLDRLGLWLEDRGWLYYRRKRPSSSPLSMFVAMQRFMEPGFQHVREGNQEKGEDEGASRERLWSGLMACLEATPVNPEQVRLYLASARNAGWDCERFYAEAVQTYLKDRPERAAHMPPFEGVKPD